MASIFHRKSAQRRSGASYDREALTPVIRCSICTGEQVAGFRRKKDQYGIEGEIEKTY